MTYRNLMLTMLLGGLWHGAAWTFVAGARSTASALPSSGRSAWRPATPAQQWFGRILTFHIVCFAWIFFRSGSFARAGEVIERLFTAWGQPSPLVTTSVVLAILVGILGQYVRPGAVRRCRPRLRTMPLLAQAAHPSRSV